MAHQYVGFVSMWIAQTHSITSFQSCMTSKNVQKTLKIRILIKIDRRYYPLLPDEMFTLHMKIFTQGQIGIYPEYQQYMVSHYFLDS